MSDNVSPATISAPGPSGDVNNRERDARDPPLELHTVTDFCTLAADHPVKVLLGRAHNVETKSKNIRRRCFGILQLDITTGNSTSCFYLLSLSGLPNPEVNRYIESLKEKFEEFQDDNNVGIVACTSDRRGHLLHSSHQAVIDIMDEAQRANFIGQIIQNMAFEVKRCGGKSIPAIMEQARSSTISAVDSQSQFLEVYAELLKEYWEQSQPGTNASQQALQSLKQLLHQKTIPESYARAIVEDLQGWLGQDSLLAFILPILVFETIIAEDIHTDISRKIPPIPMDATVPVVKMFETILKRKAHWGPGSRAYFLDVMLRIIEADQEFSREKVAQLERAIHCLQLYVVGAPVATIAIQQYFSLCAEDNLTIQLPALLNEKIAKETPITHLKATWYATQKEKEDGALPHNLPLCEKCAVVFQPRLESVLRCWLLERSTASGERNVRGGSSDGAACEPTDGVDGGTGGGQVGGSMGLGRNDVNV